MGRRQWRIQFLDWDNFKSEFCKEFCPAHSDSATINRLESTSYYQKTQSVDDYLNKFLDLIAESRYTDPKTLVIKFRRGLDPQIQNAVATMMNGWPSDMAPTTWYEAARNIDQNRASNKAFHSAHHIPTNFTNTLCPSAQSTLWPPSTQAHVKLTLGNPVPMDVDASRRRTPTILTCYWCGKPGHKVPDCPLQFDIWALTTEKLGAEVQARMAQRDVVTVEDCPSIVEEEISLLDFLPDNEWIACLHCHPITAFDVLYVENTNDIETEKQDMHKTEASPASASMADFCIKTHCPKWERLLPKQFTIAATENSPTSLKLKVKIETTDTAEKNSVMSLVDCRATGEFIMLKANVLHWSNLLNQSQCIMSMALLTKLVQ